MPDRFLGGNTGSLGKYFREFTGFETKQAAMGEISNQMISGFEAWHRADIDVDESLKQSKTVKTGGDDPLNPEKYSMFDLLFECAQMYCADESISADEKRGVQEVLVGRRPIKYLFESTFNNYSKFPLIMAAMVNAGVYAQMAFPATIMSQLSFRNSGTTDEIAKIYDVNMPTTGSAKTADLMKMAQEDYKESTFSETMAQVGREKHGATLAIDERSLLMDKTGLIMQAVNTFTEKMRMYQDRRLVMVLFDILRTFKPGGTLTDFFNTATSTVNGFRVPINSQANPLTVATGWEAVEKARAIFRSMKDANSDPIMYSAMTKPFDLICSDAMVDRWNRVKNTLEFTVDDGNGNLSKMANGVSSDFRIISSPMIDAVFAEQAAPIDEDVFLYGKAGLAYTFHSLIPFQVRMFEPIEARDEALRINIRWDERLNATHPYLISENTPS